MAWRPVALSASVIWRRSSTSFFSAPPALPDETAVSAWASTRCSTTSASAAPLQAACTIERSSRRRGLKMPGVSTSTIWAAPSMATPRTLKRVVCTLGVTIETLEPTSRFTSVDLPALGAPMTAANPARVGTSLIA